MLSWTRKIFLLTCLALAHHFSFFFWNKEWCSSFIASKCNSDISSIFIESVSEFSLQKKNLATNRTNSIQNYGLFLSFCFMGILKPHILYYYILFGCFQCKIGSVLRLWIIVLADTFSRKRTTARNWCWNEFLCFHSQCATLAHCVRVVGFTNYFRNRVAVCVWETHSRKMKNGGTPYFIVASVYMPLHLTYFAIEFVVPCSYFFQSLSVAWMLSRSLPFSLPCIYFKYTHNILCFDSLPTILSILCANTHQRKRETCTWMTCLGVNPLQEKFMVAQQYNLFCCWFFFSFSPR